MKSCEPKQVTAISLQEAGIHIRITFMMQQVSQYGKATVSSKYGSAPNEGYTLKYQDTLTGINIGFQAAMLHSFEKV